MTKTQQPRLREIFAAHVDHVSDKWEHYPDIYDAELGARVATGEPATLLEIGVQNGGSLQIWQKYLPPGSRIVGIDVDPAVADLDLGEGISVHVLDATDEDRLGAVLGDQSFDVIVDDGSHASSDVIGAFRHCFGHLKPGGVYFVEDVHCSYFAEFGGGLRRDGSMVEFFKARIDAVNALSIPSGETDADEVAALHQDGREIASVAFYDSVIVVRKRHRPRDHQPARILTGTVAPVVDLSTWIDSQPPDALRSFFMSASATERLAPLLLTRLADAREAVGRAEAASEQAEAGRREAEEETARLREGLVAAEAGRRGAEKETARLREKGGSVEAALRAELAAIQNSTFWRATQPARSALAKSPPWVRRWGRSGARRLWRAAHVTAARSDSVLRRVGWRRGPVTLPGAGGDGSYAAFCAATDPDAAILALQRRMSQTDKERPTFSVLVPVFRTPIDVFRDMVASVSRQSCLDWELCLVIVDEGKTTEALVDAARRLEHEDRRIRITLVSENRGISSNTNAGLDSVTGEWVVLLDHDDLLRSDALFEMTQAIAANPEAVFLYSDKDWIDRTGRQRSFPLLKPSWSPEIMLNANYLTHLCAMRTEVVRRIGGWDPATDGAQDWDIFLRVIQEGGAVVHLPHVLYHWRQIETSVSMGGLAAKPYAVEGQLVTLRKYLARAGWAGAEPRFDGPHLRIDWDKAGTISVVVVGGRPADLEAKFPGAADVVHARGMNLASAVDQAIKGTTGDIVVLVDGAYRPLGPETIEELAGPLANPDIAFVGGHVSDMQGRVVDHGVVFQDRVAYPVFRGEPEGYFGAAGAVMWYRNATAIQGGALAFRRETWRELGGLSAFAQSGRADLAFTLEATRRGLGRLMLNPFARFMTEAACCRFETAGVLSPQIVAQALPKGDPFLNPNLDASRHGAPSIRARAASQVPPPHDYTAEARICAAHFDATEEEIRKSVADSQKACRGGFRRVIWFIPDFSVPFFGGVNTIFRCAEHMRTRHGVGPVFAVLGASDAGTIRGRIEKAFPDLAAACEVVVSSDGIFPNLGRADAAVCTLWSTAYSLLRLRNVGRKFYFLQDWEPLFYPGGTLSTMVEATYRFGYHAITNTRSLADSYRQLGGTADHFLPSVDPDIFHVRGRPRKAPDAQFVLVSYTRPGTPRNCFEVLAEGMRRLKERHGDRIVILTAGSEWDPAQFGLGGVVRNLGLLPYAATGELYRACDAGLVAMATRHPSYLPFEWMACGATVVTNRNPYTEWLLRDEENCLLCEMTQGDVFATVSRLVEDPGLRDRLAAQAIEDIAARHSDWAATCERVYEIMQGKVLEMEAA